ncbi:hypothetical protein ADL02_20645, partial [Streptomyces sp. NRRL WC-3723]
LGDLSVGVPLGKAKLSEPLRGAPLSPRWEIVSRLAPLLGLPHVPLERRGKQPPLGAHKTRNWVDRPPDSPTAVTTHAATPPIDHRALCEHVEQDYLLYAQAF